MLTGRALGEAAYEWWGRFGVPVFPCKLVGSTKKPLVKWGSRASTDKDEIVSMFEQFGASANLIGAAMGIKAGLFALDFDLYKGPEAAEYLQTLLLSNCLPKTRVHKTRSGGLHYLYGVENEKDMLRNSVPCTGVEIRGEGGYIVVPPSEGYLVEQDEEVCDAPEQLLRRLQRAEAAFRSLSPSQLKEQIIAGTSFHEALTSLAAKLNSAGLPPNQIQKELQEAMEASVASNPRHDRHGRWAAIMSGGDGELARIASSAYKKFNPKQVDDEVRQVASKMEAAKRNRAVTLGNFFAKPPADDELPNPKTGTFGKKPQTAESAIPPDEFPFARSYNAAKVEEQDNKNFLIYPLVMESDVVVLSAAPKAGKTLTAMNICLHAAAGLPIGDQLIPMNKEGKTAPISVIYFALEGQGAIRKRVKAWILDQKAKGKEYEEKDLQIYIVEQPLNLADDASRQSLVDKLVLANAYFQSKGWGQIGMVVFDTLTKAMPGKDQNSVEDTSAVFSTVDLMREVGLSPAVFFIHHNSKSNGAPRGSGNIMAEPDTVMMVNKVDQIVEDGVYKDCYKLHVHMARAIDDSQSYVFSATSVDIGKNSQGIMENAPVLSVLDNYSAAPTKNQITIKKAAEIARTKFYETVWQTLSEAENMTMTYQVLHRTMTKGDPHVAAYYSQYMNGNSAAAAKAAWTALLSPKQLPEDLEGMSFEIGEKAVTMRLNKEQTGTE